MPDQAYAQQDVLVSTQWVADNLHRTDKVRIVESNEDVLLYGTGHIPNAVHIDWVADLNDAIRRDYLNEEQFAALMGRAGISNDTTVVFYGDKNNWWATYAFWVFKLFGHQDCRIMNGGRQKWIAEGRELTRDKPHLPATTYRPAGRPAHQLRPSRHQAPADVTPATPLADRGGGPALSRLAPAPLWWWLTVATGGGACSWPVTVSGKARILWSARAAVR